ncbi:MAG: HAD-IC family P-type ATPase, partial [Gammaproteobacteria bacterium]
LGVGVYRLGQRRALVRGAVGVENIGRVSCICTDKTGTITLGELRLAHVFPAAGIDEAGLLALAGLASRGDSGDPIDTAILRAQPQAQVGAELVRTFPFAEDRRRETNIWRRSDGTLAAMTKGAPETILAMCTLGSTEREAWRAQVAALAAEAHKVIACAVVDLVPGWHDGEPDRELRFAGLLAFEDPVRESVPEAIAQCRAAGIHVVMITGDHAATATAVAREIGLGGDEPRTLEAESLVALPQDLREVDVIARALPAQKVDVVRALQAAGEIVAVTGDGVNDVPALQIADIGLAMGERGTRTAREVSAIVLLDENFRTIIRAIVEGRQLFSNLKLSFAYLIMLHIPLVFTAALVPLAGFPLLYLPIHIVWLELILHPTALLAFQDLPAGAALVREPGRREARFFNRREWGVMLATGGGNAVLILLGYIWILDSGAAVEHARALVMALLALVSVTLLIVLSGLRSVAARWIAVLTLLPSLLMIQLPGLAEYLHVQPLHAADWAVVGACALLVAAVAMLGRFRNTDYG